MEPDVSARNKAILSALRNRFALDSDLSVEDIEQKDISSLFSSVLQLSATKISLKNEAEVLKWVTFASDFATRNGSCHEKLKSVDEELIRKAVILGDGLTPSEADIVVYSALHSFVNHLADTDKQRYPNVMRWMDYIQNKEHFGGELGKIACKVSEIECFSTKSAGKLDGEVATKKEAQESKNMNKSEDAQILKNPATERKASGDGKASKKSSEIKQLNENKEKSEKNTEVDKDSNISVLNIQVGIIRKAWKHPSADSLLVEEIDVGDGNMRQVVSGLAKYCGPEELTDRHVVLITNVKPGKLRDVMSAGLVLCASNQDHTIVEPLVPPEGAVIGEHVSFSGFTGKPEDVLNPKKKQLEKITPHLYTDEKGTATYKGVPFMTSAGPCMSSIPNASIK